MPGQRFPVPWRPMVSTLLGLSAKERTSRLALLSRQRRWTQALWELWELQALHSLAPSRLGPGTIAVNAVLTGLTTVASWQRALSLLQCLSSDIGHFGNGPDIISCSTTVTALERVARWPSAVGMLRDFASALLRPDVVAYGAGISACSVCYRWKHVVQMLRELSEVSFEPNAVLCTSCMASCASRQTAQSCEKVFSTSLWLLL